MSEEKKKDQEIESEDDVISWKVQEYTAPKKTKRWYLIAGLVGIVLIAYALFTSNLIFAVIIIIGAILIILSDGNKPGILTIELSDDGVKVGKEFYLYEQLDNFFIIYRPKEGIKNLYLEFKRFVRPQVSGAAKSGRYEWMLWLMNFARTRLSIPLDDMNPVLIRKNLLKYLKEDVERTDIPLSEKLSEMLKL
jgi:hypothetical protein